MKKLLFTFCVLSITCNLTAQKHWDVSIQTWTFHKYSLLETIDKADSLHVKYLEVFPGQQVGKGYNGPFSYTLSTDERNRLKALLAQKGIKAVAMGVIDKYFYNENNLEKFFEFASYMGFLTLQPNPSGKTWMSLTALPKNIR